MLKKSINNDFINKISNNFLSKSCENWNALSVAKRSVLFEGLNSPISINKFNEILINIIKKQSADLFVDNNYIYSAMLLRDDMCNLLYCWRLIKGYPKNGQSTHTNAKSAKKNKFFLNIRIAQFQLTFNKKASYNFTTLIICEYTNRLWALCWVKEWAQGALFLLKLVNRKTFRIPLDLNLLVKNHTTGYERIGAASKIGKAKRKIKSGTIGMPPFFSRYIFSNVLLRDFPYLASIASTVHKKKNKNKKKKK